MLNDNISSYEKVSATKGKIIGTLIACIAFIACIAIITASAGCIANTNVEAGFSIYVDGDYVNTVYKGETIEVSHVKGQTLEVYYNDRFNGKFVYRLDDKETEHSATGKRSFPIDYFTTVYVAPAEASDEWITINLYAIE